MKVLRLLPSIFEEAFPESRYFWRGDEFDVFEVADNKGLLPILVAQALMNANCFAPSMLDGWKIIESTQSLTGRGVCGPDMYDSQYILGIPWILDALYVAMNRSENPSEIYLDNIDPPTAPSLSELIRPQKGASQHVRVAPE